MSNPPNFFDPVNEYIPLKEFLKSHTQKETGLILGCSQVNVGLSLKLGREIYIVRKPNGSMHGMEIKILSKKVV